PFRRGDPRRGRADAHPGEAMPAAGGAAMTPGPDDPAAGPDPRSGLEEADRVLLLSIRAWAPAVRRGPARGAPGEEHPHARILNRLEPSWARRLLDGDGGSPAVSPGPGDRAAARERLRQAHRAEARVDLTRVHPSWWARGLREESPSVRRAV